MSLYGAETMSEPNSAERPKRRRRNAAANDELLDNVALELIAQHGVDGLSFSELSEKTGLTRAPIYARFDSPEDVAAELWSKILLSHLDDLFALNSQWYVSDQEVPSSELLQEFSSPSVKSSALVEILAVARRFPYLQDIVARDLALKIESYIENANAPRGVAVTQLSVLFGSLFLAPIFNSSMNVLTPDMSESWKQSLPIAREILTDDVAWGAEPIEASAIEIPLPSMQFDDQLLDIFVPATMLVISRSGYEHASANRIAREAGRAFNAIYEIFPNKEALMTRVVSAWVEDGINMAFTPFLGLSADDFASRSVMRGRSLVSMGNRPFRNLRNEMTLAARHHEPITENMVLLYAEAAQHGHVAFSEMYSNATDETFLEFGRIGSIVRSNGFGLCLMASCVGTLEDVDWTPASRGHQRCLYERVISKLTLRRE
ncbi:hypothetical protein GM51_11695 [freshwater metagenome]|uniref:HTH tetR-type domain-containing protein n=1 Tax=freshwater metagenome TaxID=449393 RepID=A0A094PYD4_9ZZZZ